MVPIIPTIMSFIITILVWICLGKITQNILKVVDYPYILLSGLIVGLVAIVIGWFVYYTLSN